MATPAKNKFSEGIHDFPDYLVTFVFSWLDHQDLKTISLVCHDWRYISDILWKNRINNRYIDQFQK